MWQTLYYTSNTVDVFYGCRMMPINYAPIALVFVYAWWLWLCTPHTSSEDNKGRRGTLQGLKVIPQPRVDEQSVDGFAATTFVLSKQASVLPQQKPLLAHQCLDHFTLDEMCCSCCCVVEIGAFVKPLGILELPLLLLIKAILRYSSKVHQHKQTYESQ